MRNDVLSVQDINIGDKFTGTIRSVTDFGIRRYRSSSRCITSYISNK